MPLRTSIGSISNKHASFDARDGASPKGLQNAKNEPSRLAPLAETGCGVLSQHSPNGHYIWLVSLY
jgi:hypothetical protein